MKTNYEFLNNSILFNSILSLIQEVLLSHKKEQDWVICRDVDGPRVCHTE